MRNLAFAGRTWNWVGSNWPQLSNLFGRRTAKCKSTARGSPGWLTKDLDVDSEWAQYQFYEMITTLNSRFSSCKIKNLIQPFYSGGPFCTTTICWKPLNNDWIFKVQGFLFFTQKKQCSTKKTKKISCLCLYLIGLTLGPGSWNTP